MKKVLVLIIGLFSILPMQSQDIDDVFNDGGIASIKQQVGINAGELINGYFTVLYERYFMKELGIGAHIGYLVSDGLVSPDYFPRNASFTSGYMIKLYFKGYYSDSFQGLFFEWDYQFRKKNMETFWYRYSGFGFSGGYKIKPKKIGASIYVGPLIGKEYMKRIEVDVDGEHIIESNNWEWRLQFGLNLSYSF